MNIEKVIIINRGELADEFLARTITLAGVILNEDLNNLNNTCRAELQMALQDMKRRHSNYYTGRAVVLLEMIELMDVYIDKTAFYILRAIAAETDI